MSINIHRGQRVRAGLMASFCALLLTTFALAGCGSNGGTGSSSGMTSLTIGLTYVPNIQFAPFYAAQQQGYYKAAGLNVTLRHHNFGEDEFAALAAGRENLIFASGDEVLQARAKGLPVTYIANVFTQYPVTLIVPASSSIQSVADLKGHTIGVPGLYGATYIGLLDLLHTAGLSSSDVKIQSIGYTQVPALVGNKVDAVMGYVNNEPIQFQKAGFAVRDFPVSKAQPLISNGIAAEDSELTAHSAAIKAFIAATMKGVNYTIAHPQETVSLSQQFVPGLSDPTNAAAAQKVLEATIPVITPNASKPGYTDPTQWQAMATFLQQSGQLSGQTDASKSLSNAYLPSA
ncbi:MAG TPA: ABC transporter substrate-binding protein [Ktedonobacterales bacterium]